MVGVYLWEVSRIRFGEMFFRQTKEHVAFNTLLNASYDVVIKLDKDMCIDEGGDKLAGMLLLDHRNLNKTQFQNLIYMDDDKQRFNSCIAGPLVETQAVANVLHVHLRDAIGNHVAVSLFHASVLDVDNQLGHIIGIREETSLNTPRPPSMAESQMAWAAGKLAFKRDEQEAYPVQGESGKEQDSSCRSGSVECAQRPKRGKNSKSSTSSNGSSCGTIDEEQAYAHARRKVAGPDSIGLKVRVADYRVEECTIRFADSNQTCGSAGGGKQESPHLESFVLGSAAGSFIKWTQAVLNMWFHEDDITVAEYSNAAKVVLSLPPPFHMPLCADSVQLNCCGDEDSDSDTGTLQGNDCCFVLDFTRISQVEGIELPKRNSEVLIHQSLSRARPLDH
jgi:hypothetical protein